MRVLFAVHLTGPVDNYFLFGYQWGSMLCLLFILLGLPGLGNFIGEILVLMGAYQANIGLTILATVGLVLATVCSSVPFTAPMTRIGMGQVFTLKRLSAHLRPQH